MVRWLALSVVLTGCRWDVDRIGGAEHDGSSTTADGSQGDGTPGDGALRDGPIGVAPRSRSIAVGSTHGCAIVGAGQVYCWGSNALGGAVGDGSGAEQPRPVAIALSDAVALAAGRYHACALRAGGTVACWGKNNAGQLGDRTLDDRPIPGPVTGITDAVVIAASWDTSCAIRATGDLLCWGATMLLDQSGDCATTSSFNFVISDTPVGMGASDAIDVACGERHVCAVRASGEVVCQGLNLCGELGDGTTTGRATMAPVSGLTDAVAVTSWGRSTCAQRSGGAVSCWGLNNFGEIADGTTSMRTVPVDAPTYAGAVEVLMGEIHSCALRPDETVTCRGSDDAGQLGDGNGPAGPNDVVALADAVGLGLGAWTSFAWTAGGSLLGWGSNQYGQVGDGTTTDRNAPVVVIP